MVIYTMVGYGDMVPITKLGKLITTFWMITCIALVDSPSAVFPGHVLCKTEISLVNKQIIALQLMRLIQLPKVIQILTSLNKTLTRKLSIEL